MTPPSDHNSSWVRSRMATLSLGAQRKGGRGAGSIYKDGDEAQPLRDQGTTGSLALPTKEPPMKLAYLAGAATLGIVWLVSSAATQSFPANRFVFGPHPRDYVP